MDLPEEYLLAGLLELIQLHGLQAPHISELILVFLEQLIQVNRSFLLELIVVRNELLLENLILGLLPRFQPIKLEPYFPLFVLVMELVLFLSQFYYFLLDQMRVLIASLFNLLPLLLQVLQDVVLMEDRLAWLRVLGVHSLQLFLFVLEIKLLPLEEFPVVFEIVVVQLVEYIVI